MRLYIGFCLFVALVFTTSIDLCGQEEDIRGLELSIDQDYFADFLRSDPFYNRNYAISLRLGMYGALANEDVLGLPWVRDKVDYFLFDQLLYSMGFIEEQRSHNIAFSIVGFSPSIISDVDSTFQEAFNAGYRLEDDRPFSSFTGFRSSRRLEGYRPIPHAAGRMDIALTTSLSVGFSGIGLTRALDNLFGARRPQANLWAHDDEKPYPTGQNALPLMPLFMYSVSSEFSIWRPMRQVLFQLRPELNFGHYTNIGVGLDFGKVMNVERLIDNLSYTDINNPGVLAISDKNFAFSIVGGVAARAVLYNAYLNGAYFGLGTDHHIPFSDTKKIIFEGYVGFKMQFFRKVELNFSIQQRSSEFKGGIERDPMWGTFGLKYLIAQSGEGCYD